MTMDHSDQLTRVTAGPGEVQVVRSIRRVRAFFDGTTIADSADTRLLLEPGRLPVYYFPPEHVRTDLLREPDPVRRGRRGETRRWTVRVRHRSARAAVWCLSGTTPELKPVAGLLGIAWSRMDSWFEEDEEVYVHPRSPYHRVDVLDSSRHVTVQIGDVVLAESDRPRMLFETGLPVRYYLPRDHVHHDLLQPEQGTSQCPYKGIADYWSLRPDIAGTERGERLAWGYRFPLPEVQKVAGLLAFFDERLMVSVDGRVQQRPRTRWS